MFRPSWRNENKRRRRLNEAYTTGLDPYLKQHINTISTVHNINWLVPR